MVLAGVTWRHWWNTESSPQAWRAVLYHRIHFLPSTDPHTILVPLKSGISKLRASFQHPISIKKKSGFGPDREIPVKGKNQDAPLKFDPLHTSKGSLEKKLHNVLSVNKNGKIRD